MDAEDPAGLLRRALRSIAIFSLRLDPPGALPRSERGLWHRTRRARILRRCSLWPRRPPVAGRT
jgi:hypothetical protein